VAPKSGIRKVTARIEPAGDVAESPTPQPAAGLQLAIHEPQTGQAPVASTVETSPSTTVSPPVEVRAAEAASAAAERRAPAEMRSISHDQWSLRVTIDGVCKADLEKLTALLSHKTRGDLAAVLHEAIRPS
jgi:hypothetical protein